MKKPKNFLIKNDDGSLNTELTNIALYLAKNKINAQIKDINTKAVSYEELIKKLYPALDRLSDLYRQIMIFRNYMCEFDFQKTNIILYHKNDLNTWYVIEPKTTFGLPMTSLNIKDAMYFSKNGAVSFKETCVFELEHIEFKI